MTNMSTYLKSLGNTITPVDIKMSIDLLMETILTDNILMKEIANDVIKACQEYNDKAGTTETRKNAVIVVSKLIGYFRDSIDNDVATDVVEDLVKNIEVSDIKVRRTIAEYLGIVILANENLMQ